MSMEQTWRWYGPDDPVALSDISQAGATGIVTALHHVPIGESWDMDNLLERKRMIEWDDSCTPPKKRGLVWSVIESIPVHEDIKLGNSERDKWIEKYIQSIRNVSEIGIETVCYNFMPVVDWTRTNLDFILDNGSKTLAFDYIEYVAFDVYILKRENAEKSYDEETLEIARQKFEAMTDDEKLKLQQNIIAGLPGAQEGYTLEEFKNRLKLYNNIDGDTYRKNLEYFLKAVIPEAEKAGVKMTIHPDDPPISLFGLPRVVSKESDLVTIFNMCDSVNNGFTLCTGSYGVLAENDIAGMVRRHGDRLHFVHLRNIRRLKKFSFFESGHLTGDVDMFGIISAILDEQERRHNIKRADEAIPMRADHGLAIFDDLRKNVNPGYSGIGRLKGLAELRGLEMSIEKFRLLNKM